MTTKAQRRRLHRAINNLSPDAVAEIVRQEFPKANGKLSDQLAKAVIAGAHRQVSPRRMQRG
jgi:hypothetical protein